MLCPGEALEYERAHPPMRSDRDKAVCSFNQTPMISFLRSRKLLKGGTKPHLNSHLYILTQGASGTELGRKERKMFASQISTPNEPRMAKEEARFEM